MKRTVTACLVVAAAFIANAHGEIAPQSKEQLQAGATEIAIGTVKAIFSEETRDTQWLKTAGVVEIRVTKLEKGQKIETGDCLYARFWKQAWIGKGNPPPSGSGHQLPKKGDSIRAYLKKNDGGYDALLPNGFEVIPKTEGTKPKQ